MSKIKIQFLRNVVLRIVKCREFWGKFNNVAMYRCMYLEQKREIATPFLQNPISERFRVFVNPRSKGHLAIGPISIRQVTRTGLVCPHPKLGVRSGWIDLVIWVRRINPVNEWIRPNFAPIVILNRASQSAKPSSIRFTPAISLDDSSDLHYTKNSRLRI